MRKILILLLLVINIPASRAQDRQRDWNPRTDGRHIVSFTPFSGTVAYGYFNPTLSFDYEYILSPEKGIGLRLPFSFGFEGPEQNDFFNGDQYRHNSLYATPGLRFHTPMGRRSAEFCTGPALLLGNLHFRKTGYYNNGLGPSTFNYGMAGLIADNSLNIYRNHFVFGFDVRTGYLFEVQDDNRFFINFGIHFGGKF